ncbi:MAG: hypothetical protein NC412_01840 [Roseburia sp.]|nr:hypothetical protein [Roseburia sp.]MCM1277999.1 hypothetical protein [Robinsoniella sp.]
MKKCKKMIAALLIGVTMTTTTAYSVGAMPLFYAAGGRDKLKVYVMANTTKGVKTNTTSYNLKKGKYVKKVTVRLKEGSYDKSASTTSGLVKISKTNNPFKTAKATWSWTYYK